MGNRGSKSEHDDNNEIKITNKDNLSQEEIRKIRLKRLEKSNLDNEKRIMEENAIKEEIVPQKEEINKKIKEEENKKNEKMNIEGEILVKKIEKKSVENYPSKEIILEEKILENKISHEKIKNFLEEEETFTTGDIEKILGISFKKVETSDYNKIINVSEYYMNFFDKNTQKINLNLLNVDSIIFNILSSIKGKFFQSHTEKVEFLYQSYKKLQNFNKRNYKEINELKKIIFSYILSFVTDPNVFIEDGEIFYEDVSQLFDTRNFIFDEFYGILYDIDFFEEFYEYFKSENQDEPTAVHNFLEPIFKRLLKSSKECISAENIKFKQISLDTLNILFQKREIIDFYIDKSLTFCITQLKNLNGRQFENINLIASLLSVSAFPEESKVFKIIYIRVYFSIFLN